MNNSTLALCIPAYNAASYLPKLLDSAKKQAIPFDEILVYNDCSTDDTAEIANKYGAKVITGDKNRGCSFGKNKLAEITDCAWIHFHDADDLLLPNFTEIAHKWIQNTEAPDIILLNFEYVDYSTGEVLGSPTYDRNELISNPKKFVIQNKIVNFAVCRRSSFSKIGGFDLDEEVLYNEDRAFYTRAALAGLSFDFESVITCINYRYSQSMSASNVLKCSYAYYHVSRKLATALGDKYPEEIAKGLWDNATIAASCKDWHLTKLNLDLATKLNGQKPLAKDPILNLICRIDPFTAYWIRENLIRLFKPKLRANGK